MTRWISGASKVLAVAGLLIFSTSFSAFAAVQTKYIKDVGCHINRTTCFVYIEGTISSACANNDGSFRWNGTSDTNGNAILSILLAAQASGKQVTFGESGCFENFPTFNYATIKK
ncbi:hypothetical protein [Agarilytica rhodophyticola]|uniref:hypothetical protein n=1 Tax=Agarilytica rhodophyticola TaxID=1737490 RepID=UPI000CD9C6CD|nr:hypothetical protein [Agarilytica rhodophyticola]